MKVYTRDEIRRRALRAAAAVAVSFVAGCSAPGNEPVAPAQATTDGTNGALTGDVAAAGDGATNTDGRAAGGADAQVTQDTAALDTAAEDTAGVDTAAVDAAAETAGNQSDSQSGADGEADVAQVDAAADAAAEDAADSGADVADAKDTTGHCDQSAGWEAYNKCCNEVNWDFEKGCMAWGPPVPPTLRRPAAREVA